MIDLSKVPSKAKEAGFLFICLAIIDLVFDSMSGVRYGFNAVIVTAIVLSAIMIPCGYGILAGNKIAFMIMSVLAVISFVGGIVEIAVAAGVNIDVIQKDWFTGIVDVFISFVIAYELSQKETREHCGF